MIHQDRQDMLTILSLALGAFAIGVAEFAAMGLLPYYAAGLGVTEPEAGHAVSAYAIGVVVGAPVVAVLRIGGAWGGGSRPLGDGWSEQGFERVDEAAVALLAAGLVQAGDVPADIARGAQGEEEGQVADV